MKMKKVSALDRLRNKKAQIKLLAALNKAVEVGQSVRTPKTFDQKTYENTLAKVTFNSGEYSYDARFAPNAAFYKFLAKDSSESHRLKLNLPDTVVYGDSGHPIWLYTAANGEVHRTNHLDTSDLVRRFEQQHAMDASAIVKVPSWSDKASCYSGLKVQILTDIDLRLRLGELSAGRSCVLQKYVKSRGPVAFLARSVYQKAGRSHVHVLSSKSSIYNQKLQPTQRCTVDVYNKGSFNVTSTYSGRYFDETMVYVKRIASFLEKNLRVEMLELVCDFIKDESDVWWFVTCKAFKVRGTPSLNTFLSSGQFAMHVRHNTEYERLKRCRLCQCPLPPQQLTHQLTIQMITFTDQHLRERGIRIQWLDRAEYRHSNHATVYQSYPVCSSCYHLYELAEELTEMQSVLAHTFGLPPKRPALPQEKAAVPENIRPMRYFRLLLVLSDVQECAVSSELKLTASFFGRTHVFETQTRVQPSILPINRFRLFQFFAYSREELGRVLERHPNLSIQVTDAHGASGLINLELEQFKNPVVLQKFYYKTVELDNSAVGFLNCKVALVEETELIDLTNIEVEPFEALFIPPDHFLLCVALPDEWFSLLPDCHSAHVPEQPPQKVQPVYGRYKVLDDYKQLKRSPIEGVELQPAGAQIGFDWTVTMTLASQPWPCCFDLVLPRDYPLTSPLIYSRSSIKHPSQAVGEYLQVSDFITAPYTFEKIINVLRDLLDTPGCAWSKVDRPQRPQVARFSNRSSDRCRLHNRRYSEKSASYRRSRDSSVSINTSTRKSSIHRRATSRFEERLYTVQVTVGAALTLPETDEPWEVHVSLMNNNTSGEESDKTAHLVHFGVTAEAQLQGKEEAVLKLLRKTKATVMLSSGQLSTTFLVSMKMLKYTSFNSDTYSLTFSDGSIGNIDISVSLTVSNSLPTRHLAKLSKGIYTVAI